MAIFSRLIVASLLAQCILGQQLDECGNLKKKSSFLSKTQRQQSISGIDPASEEYPCPDAEVIRPCACTNDGSIFLACSNVTSEQMAAVFQQEFPVKDVGQLFIFDSPLLTSLDFDLNGVTLEFLNVQDASVATIVPGFLEGSYETLQRVEIWHSQLTTEGFIFDTLSNYENLEVLVLRNNNMDTLPSIYSPSLVELDIENTSISELAPGSFDGAPNLRSFTLWNNEILELAEGTIPIRYSDGLFKINTPEYIAPGAFYAASENGSMYEILFNNGKLTELLPGSVPIGWSTSIITFNTNEIVDVQPGFFTFLSYPPEDSFSLIFDSNQVTVLPEDVYGPLMPYLYTLNFDHNPLTCGCDIAWLVRNSTLMSKISQYATCADGTLMHDLHVEDYQDC